MKKLFYESPYMKEFSAEVLSCREGKKGFEVILDRTAFYPEGGGQPADKGTLGGARVLDVHEKDGNVVHYTDTPLKEGETVEGRIDWERRFSLMQEHSGEHLVSGLIHSHFGYDNVGFHMGSEEVSIDFNGLLTWEDLMKIETEANEIIFDNREIEAGFPPKEELEILDYRSKKELNGDIRIVKIPGGDICACCGTHVKKTGEIGIVKFLSMIHYKGGVRITLLCGKRALMDYEARRDQLQKISVMLSAKTGETAAAVEKLKLELAACQSKAAELSKRLIESKVEKLPVCDGNFYLMEPDFDAQQLRLLVNRILEEKKGKTVLALGSIHEGYSYVLGSQSEDMRLLSKGLNGLLNGRGGGSSQMAQGTFFTGKETLCAVLKEKGFSCPDT